MNFQSHKRSDFEFHQGVNVIVGESDAGKSTVIRALKWLTRNRPQGDSIRSNWCQKDDITVVKMWASDPRLKAAHASREISSKGEQIYSLGPQLFKAFRTDVPQELQDYFNMSEVNLQMQADSHFLLSLSPGDVAQYFNKVAKLDKIDTGLNNVNSWIRELTATIGQPATKDKPATGLLKQIADKEAELLTFEHLEEFEEEVLAIEGMAIMHNDEMRQYDLLDNLTRSIYNVDMNIKQASTILEMEDDLNDIFSDISDLKELKEKHVKLTKASGTIKFLDSLCKQKEGLLSMEEPVNKILQLMTDHNLAVERKRKLSTTLSYIESTNDRINKGMSYIASKEAEFEKEMPDICPLCGENRVKPSMVK
jgi:DNA repair exonuclease SbcCD ATPase subunit